MTRIPLDRARFLHPIAHRGLHDTAAGIVENSGPAFAAAIAGGYGIECDLRPIAGSTPVVFHDATLDRLIGTSGAIGAVTPDRLPSLRYADGSGVLTFAALLDQVAGSVPLLVEVKSEWEAPDETFLGAIARLAESYGGPIALISFDPAVIGRLAVLAPDIPRGLVSGSYRATTGEGWWKDRITPERAAALREMRDFDACGASFCAYEVGALPTAATDRLRREGYPVFAWTVRAAADKARAEAHADAIIFEGFRA